ncbi:MAG: hypothetical protein ACON4I_00130 [Candidatus Puniceispirillaceae bacterium]
MALILVIGIHQGSNILAGDAMLDGVASDPGTVPGLFWAHFLLGILIWLVSFFIWCWFLTRWIEAEFDLVSTMPRMAFLKHVCWQQFLALLIAGMLFTLFGLFTMSLYAFTILPALVPILSPNPADSSGMIQLAMGTYVSMVIVTTPVFLMAGYAYVRYSAALGLVARTGRTISIGKAFTLCGQHAPPRSVLRTIGFPYLYLLLVPAIMVVVSMLLARDWLAAMIPVPGNPVVGPAAETTFMLTSFGLLLGLVWTLAIPLVMGFFLIRFLQRIDSAVPATSEIIAD